MCAVALRYDPGVFAPQAAASAPASPAPASQAPRQAKAAATNSQSCVNCHQGIEPMHGLWRAPDEPLPADATKRGMDRQGLTCVDCHGGNGTAAAKEAAHVPPRNRKIFSSSANPRDSYAALNEESPEFVRFMNPSDYRVADLTCGRCHADVLSRARKSIMAHNAMVHNAVFYNNGAIETKVARYGEAFDSQGRPAELVDSTPPSPEARAHGALDKVTPHPEFQISKIKDPLRIAEINNPALGTRGPGTKGRIAATFLNVMKTRLNDPTTWFLGPNKIAGDYRNSGCASCHVIYANDRSYLASGEHAKYGNSGQTFTNDKAMAEVKARRESGHPIKHQFSLTIPASQCMTCHYHQGDGAIGTFLGRIWWDRETDADAVKAAGAEPEYGKAMEAMAEYNECQTCHSSWQTTCSGCHLPLDLNVKSKDKHYDDRSSRGHAGYFRQAIRTDTFFVGIGTKNHGSKLTPFRPASAVVVSAWDRNRNNVVHQQPLVSAAGFSNESVTPHPPHTVRVKETRTCSDCHLSERGDNNARISLLLGFGANSLNFMGTYAFVGEQGKGVAAVKVTDGHEPQPVIGSNFHRVLDPAGYDKFVARGRKLDTAYSRRAPGIQSVAARGEYLLAAEGANGVRVYDIANINNKSVAQRIVRAVNSPLGEKLGVSTHNATFVHLPSSLPVHVGSSRRVLNRTKTIPQIREENEEQNFHDLYRYALITDADEGLILADVDTLTDADPENNRIKRVVTFNPQGKLSGARMVKNLGTYAFVVSEKTGLSVVDLKDPDTPRLAYHSSPGALNGARAIELQLRYAFILDRDGMKVWDVTEPEKPKPLPGAQITLADARGLTVTRTFAYIAAGRQGLVIVDVETPEKPRVLEYDRSQASIDDAYDVAVATTNVSFFAYVADGRNGLKVVRLVEPPDTPGHLGFSPDPTPKLIATYPTGGPAIAVNRGQVRDRFVDEAGNQMVISNRYGARTLNYDEIRRFLYYPDGKLLTVSDDVPKFLYDTRNTEWQTTKAATK